MPSTSAITVPEPDSIRPCTIADFLNLFRGEIHDREEFRARLEDTERRFGKSEVLNDLITWIADVGKLYLWENCSSIYSLLGRMRFGSLPHEKSSICGAIERANALVHLTGFTYHSHMIDYLSHLGPAKGRGIFNADGQPVGFALADFARHRTKLIPLLRLVESGKAPMEPNWGKFFDSGYLEYKAYCFSMMADKIEGTFTPPRAAISDAHRPGGIAERMQDCSLDVLDPFRNSAPPSLMSLEGTLESHEARPIVVQLPHFSTSSLSVGSLPWLKWLLPDGHINTASSESGPILIDNIACQ